MGLDCGLLVCDWLMLLLLAARFDLGFVGWLGGL